MTKLHYNSMCVTGTVPLDTAQIGPSACPKSKAILATWLVERSIVGLDRTKHLKSISRSFCVSVITDGNDHSSMIWGCKYLLLQRSCLKLQTCTCICKRMPAWFELCHNTMTPARTPRLGLCLSTLAPARTLRLGLCHNTLTPARTPRLWLCHNTLTSQQEHLGLGCHNTLTSQQEHLGLGCHNTLTRERTPRLGLCHNTLTPARTPRLGLCHNTLTSQQEHLGLGCVTTH